MEVSAPNGPHRRHGGSIKVNLLLFSEALWHFDVKEQQHVNDRPLSVYLSSSFPRSRSLEFVTVATTPLSSSLMP